MWLSSAKSAGSLQPVSLSRAKAWGTTDDDIWKMSMASQLDPLLARFLHRP